MNKETCKKFVTLTREQIKQRMMFDKKEDIKMFESVCKEILNEKCNWEYDNEEEYWATGCGNAYVFLNESSPLEEDYVFCLYCGKPIEDISK